MEDTHNECKALLLVVSLDFSKLTLVFLFFNGFSLYLSSFFLFHVFRAGAFGALLKNKRHSLAHREVFVATILSMNKCTGTGISNSTTQRMSISSSTHSSSPSARPMNPNPFSVFQRCCECKVSGSNGYKPVAGKNIGNGVTTVSAYLYSAHLKLQVSFTLQVRALTQCAED